MELTITKEKVLEAASKCSQAKDILQTLFPEVFKKYKGPIFPVKSHTVENKMGHEVVIHDHNAQYWLVALEDTGEITLSPRFLWEMRETERLGFEYVLIPTRKP